MSMALNTVNQAFYEEMQKLLDSKKEAVIANRCATIEDYKYLTGVIFGLSTALAYHKELVQNMINAEMGK